MCNSGHYYSPISNLVLPKNSDTVLLNQPTSSRRKGRAPMKSILTQLRFLKNSIRNEMNADISIRSDWRSSTLADSTEVEKQSGQFAPGSIR